MAKGITAPKATSTGTTIVGLEFKDGVILGADTRSTEGEVVADKNCAKIHYLAPNLYCCGAGTAADTEYTTNLISSQLELHRLQTGRQTRVITALALLKRLLYKYQGQLGAALVLGGYDVNGPMLQCIHPFGSTDRVPFTTMGSGSLAAISMFESKWKEGLERSEAIELAVEAVEAGIFNDMGSGSNVDIVVLEKDKVEVLRNYVVPTVRPTKEQCYKYKKGTTAVIKESIYNLVKVADADEMDMS